MSQIDSSELVGPLTIVREIGIPRATLHLMTRQGRIPHRDVTQPWHTKRRQYRYVISEVREALDRMERERDAGQVAV
jgi:hypothetical protein